ncbi:hypothetical protein [Geoalkalibacter sp.]|jgi:hypothetical protein|uniref:hypothetical protein n=1 Tax=Geoalkalibacter sp. TaxID=3041440 RepID=UPI00272E93B9|nr:hypothetical protein [Geoalkalibacter sp.]
MLPSFHRARLHVQVGGLDFPALSLSGEDAISSRRRKNTRTRPPRRYAAMDQEGRLLSEGYADHRIAALLRSPE